MMEGNRPVDRHELDLLVDGELSEDRRRTLLSRMDRDPESWRQLALSFVENQIWGDDFRQIVSETSARQTIADDSFRATLSDSMNSENQTSFRFRYRDAFLATAVMLALGAGYLMGGKFSGVAVPENRTKNMVWPELVILPDRSTQLTRPQFAVDNDNPNIPSDLKVIDWDDRPPRWSESLNPSLSQEFLSALRKSGLAVEEQRELILVRLKDGRSMFVPVNNVRMRYVGDKIFQ